MSVIEAHHFGREVLYTSEPRNGRASSDKTNGGLLENSIIQVGTHFLRQNWDFVSVSTAPNLASIATVTTMLFFSGLSDDFLTAPGYMTFVVAPLSRKALNAWQ